MTQNHRGQRLVSYLLMGLLALGIVDAASARPAFPAVHHRHTHHPVKAVRKSRHRDRDRIAEFVATVQPKKGKAYARRVARAIRRSAGATGISPDVLLATGYVESELRMTSGPCVGLMQVHPRTLREMCRRIPAARRLDPRRVEDNIQLGALELAGYYRRVPAKSGRTTRLRHALGRYNGAGPNSGYVRRVSTVLRRIRKGDSSDWQRHLQQHGPLWRA